MFCRSREIGTSVRKGKEKRTVRPSERRTQVRKPVEKNTGAERNKGKNGVLVKR